MGQGVRQGLGLPLCLHTRIPREALYLHTQSSVEVYRRTSLMSLGTLGEGEVGEVSKREEGGCQEALKFPRLVRTAFSRSDPWRWLP